PDHRAERNTEEGAFERKTEKCALHGPLSLLILCSQAIIMQTILDHIYVDAAPCVSVFFPDLANVLGRTFVAQLRCREWVTSARKQGL
ncbi:unnamed protein product, partial [Bubo scandiacus]